MRFWINFSKDAPLRFLSHLDLLRLWQRAVRRSKLPVAYSAGFNPHQRISFASALAVGATSGDEYLDILFSEPVTEDGFHRLEQSLPEGMRIIGRRDVQPGVAPLMSLVGAARWQACFAEDKFFSVNAVGELLAAASLSVEREGKKGKKTVDIRPLLYSLDLHKEDGRYTLSMLLQTGGDGGARPAEILALLGLAQERVTLHREALYIRVGNYLQSPMTVVFVKDEVQIDAKKDYYQL
jgi:radical SAM-linked protein